jgi:hypothetical protein
VPSVMDSPIWGMTTSVGIGRVLRGYKSVRKRNCGLYER